MRTLVVPSSREAERLSYPWKGSLRLSKPPCVFGVIPKTFGALGKGRSLQREY